MTRYTLFAAGPRARLLAVRYVAGGYLLSVMEASTSFDKPVDELVQSFGQLEVCRLIAGGSGRRPYYREKEIPNNMPSINALRAKFDSKAIKAGLRFLCTVEGR